MADISSIPLVNVPFADSDQQKVTNIDFLKSGVTAAMTAPTKNGGIVFTRNHLNGIGYFATLGAFLDRIGYPYGIRRDSSADFGGYPKGAILISEDNDYVREYVSQIDNNTYPLPSEAADGTYEGNEYWKPTLPSVADFYPDFSTYVIKKTISIEGKGKVSYTPDEDGWYQLSVIYSGQFWSETPTSYLRNATCSVQATSSEICRLDGINATTMKSSNYVKEFPISTSLVPLRKGVTITFVYVHPDMKFYNASIEIRRWGVSAI